MMHISLRDIPALTLVTSKSYLQCVCPTVNPSLHNVRFGGCKSRGQSTLGPRCCLVTPWHFTSHPMTFHQSSHDNWHFTSHPMSIPYLSSIEYVWLQFQINCFQCYVYADLFLSSNLLQTIDELNTDSMDQSCSKTVAVARHKTHKTYIVIHVHEN